MLIIIKITPRAVLRVSSPSCTLVSVLIGCALLAPSLPRPLLKFHILCQSSTSTQEAAAERYLNGFYGMIGHYNELGLRVACQVERLRDHGKIYQTLAEMQSKRTYGSRSSSSVEVRTGRESDETRRDECTAGKSDDGVSLSLSRSMA